MLNPSSFLLSLNIESYTFYNLAHGPSALTHGKIDLGKISRTPDTFSEEKGPYSFLEQKEDL